MPPVFDRSGRRMRIAPHSAALTEEAMSRTGMTAAKDIVRVLRGQIAINVANRQIKDTSFQHPDPGSAASCAAAQGGADRDNPCRLSRKPLATIRMTASDCLSSPTKARCGPSASVTARSANGDSASELVANQTDHAETTIHVGNEACSYTLRYAQS
jgi:hypothetical protein